MSGKLTTRRVAADAAGIAEAVEVLRGGGLVAIPTETVYGLAARADSEEAVSRIYAAKGRPDFNPLIVHVAGPEQASALAEFPPEARAYAEEHWPGPVTLVLPRKAEADLAPSVTAGLDTLALRVPAHPVAQQVLEELGLPLAAPSANRSGFTSPTTAEHVLATLDGRIDLVLDAGPTRAGLESTILKWQSGGGWRRLRPGPVADPSAAHCEPQDGEAIEAPGQLASHYSPGKPVRLEATDAQAGEFLIGFGPVSGDCTLSESGNLGEAAARLYACLHLAAQSGHPRVAVAPVPETGVGVAINDRLRRAAA